MKYLFLALLLLFMGCSSVSSVINERIQEFKNNHPECHITVGERKGKPFLFVAVKGQSFDNTDAEGRTVIFYRQLIECEILQEYTKRYGYSIDFPDNKGSYLRLTGIPGIPVLLPLYSI
jgi:hypothetical protein